MRSTILIFQKGITKYLQNFYFHGMVISILFLKKFNDNVVHGEKLENFLKEIWHPEFLIFNAENPRTTHYKTLNVFEGKLQLFERFDSELSIDADMPYYPFGGLNLNMDILAFSGNVDLMEFIPEEILVGHDDNEDLKRKVIKGNWLLDEKKIKSSQMQSLNHGGEKFSVLISNISVKHKFMNSLFYNSVSCFFNCDFVFDYQQLLSNKI